MYIAYKKNITKKLKVLVSWIIFLKIFYNKC